MLWAEHFFFEHKLITKKQLDHDFQDVWYFTNFRLLGRN